MGSIAAVLGFFYYPETKGVRFEKLDELYAAGVPPRQFKKRAREDTTDTVVGAKEIKVDAVQAQEVEFKTKDP